MLKDKAIRDIKREVMYSVFKQLKDEGYIEASPVELQHRFASAVADALKKRGINKDDQVVEFLVNLCLLYAQYRYFGSI